MSLSLILFFSNSISFCSVYFFLCNNLPLSLKILFTNCFFPESPEKFIEKYLSVLCFVKSYFYVRNRNLYVLLCVLFLRFNNDTTGQILKTEKTAIQLQKIIVNKINLCLYY